MKFLGFFFVIYFGEWDCVFLFCEFFYGFVDGIELLVVCFSVWVFGFELFLGFSVCFF